MSTVSPAAGFAKIEEYLRDGEGRIECTSVRTTATATPQRPRTLRLARRGTDGAAAQREVEVWLDGKRRRVSCIEPSALRESGRWNGPRLITEYSSTSFVAPGWTLRTDAAGNLLLER